MAVVKTSEEAEMMRISGALLARCLDMLVICSRAGRPGKEVDAIAEEFIRDHNAIPAFKNYGDPKNPFPGSICFSKNSVIVHGIPGEESIQEGDMVTIDCGLSLNGWYADAARLFGVGQMEQDDIDIMLATEAALRAGIDACVVGNQLGDVSHAIQLSSLHSPYHNVVEFCGHAIGQGMHEEPQVPNAGVKGQGLELEPGMVFCLEPMLKKTAAQLGVLPDRWTVATRDGSRATHIEEMVLITETRPEILTA